MEIKTIHCHDELAYFEAGDHVVVWNRFFPSVLRFPQPDFTELLKIVDKNKEYDNYSSELIDSLKKNNIINEQSSKERYIEQMNRFIDQRAEDLKEFIENKKPFYSIQIYNEQCNLKCGYCIMGHTWGHPFGSRKRLHASTEKVHDNIRGILDLQYESLKKQPQNFVFSINGGEFTLLWDVLKDAVEYIRIDKNDSVALISINSNGTTMTAGMAEFIVKHNINVHFSIDCNRSHHDATRVHGDGRGTFDEVVRAVGLLKAAGYTGDSLSCFQGTIEDFQKIDPDEFQELAELGFQEARLSPNLMGYSEAEGRARALQFYTLIEASRSRQIRIYDSIFDSNRNGLDQGINFKYWPYCNGLGGSAQNSLMYNVSDGSLSYLCQYVPAASVPLADPADMHAMAMADQKMTFIRARIEAVKTHCMDCSIVGICRGGCIMDGLRSDNTPNAAGCGYQQTLWQLFVESVQAAKTMGKRMDPVTQAAEV